MHSLEPLRPWKAEQLGGGYALSSLVRAGRGRIGGRGGGGFRRHAGRRAGRLSGHCPRTGSGSSATGSTPREYAPDPGTDVLARARRRPRPALRHLRRPGHPAEGAAGAAAGGAAARPGRAARALRGPAGHPELAAEVTGLVERAAGGPVRRGLDLRRCCRSTRSSSCSRTPRVRLPVGVRAARHREPGGDGVRHGRRGLPRRRHPGGRQRRRDRAAGAAGRPGRAGRRAERAAAATRAGPPPWARWAGSARSRSSAGRRSPRRRRRSTPSWPADPGTDRPARVPRPGACPAEPADPGTDRPMRAPPARSPPCGARRSRA